MTKLIAWLAIGTLCAPAAAQQLSKLTTNKASAAVGEPVHLTIEATPTRESGVWCGLSIAFGDGEFIEYRLDSPKHELSHSYAKPGTYQVRVEGKAVMRGLRSAFPCEGDAKTLLIRVTDAAQRGAPSPPGAVPRPAIEQFTYSVLPNKRLLVKLSVDGQALWVIKNPAKGETQLFSETDGKRVSMRFEAKKGLTEILEIKSGLRIAVDAVGNERIEYRLYSPARQFIVGSVLYRKQAKWLHGWMASEKFQGYPMLQDVKELSLPRELSSAPAAAAGSLIASWFNRINLFPVAHAQANDDAVRALEQLTSAEEFLSLPVTMIGGAMMTGAAAFATTLLPSGSGNVFPTMGRVAVALAEYSPYIAAAAATLMVGNKLYQRYEGARQAREARLTEDDLRTVNELEQSYRAAQRTELAPAPAATAPIPPSTSSMDTYAPEQCGYTQRVSGKCEPQITLVTPNTARVGKPAQFVATGRYLFNGLEVFIPNCTVRSNGEPLRSTGDGKQQKVSCTPTKPGNFRGTWSVATSGEVLSYFYVEFLPAEEPQPEKLQAEPPRPAPPKIPAIQATYPKVVKVGRSSTFVATGTDLPAMRLSLPGCTGAVTKGEPSRQHLNCTPSGEGTHQVAWTDANSNVIIGSATVIVCGAEQKVLLDGCEGATKPPTTRTKRTYPATPACPGAKWKYQAKRLNPAGAVIWSVSSSDIDDATVPRSDGNQVLQAGVHKWTGGDGSDRVEQDLGLVKVTVIDFQRDGACEIGAKVAIKWEERNNKDGYVLTNVAEYSLIK